MHAYNIHAYMHTYIFPTLPIIPISPYNTYKTHNIYNVYNLYKTYYDAKDHVLLLAAAVARYLLHYSQSHNI